MTDRYHSLTVVLEHDIRDDDAEPLLNAIRMIRGVASVTGQVADSVTYMAKTRARQELIDKLFDAINGTTP